MQRDQKLQNSYKGLLYSEILSSAASTVEKNKLLKVIVCILHNISVYVFFKTISESANDQDEVQNDEKRLTQAEEALGDHVTGGVVQSWKRVQRRFGDVLSEGKTHSDQSLK